MSLSQWTSSWTLFKLSILHGKKEQIVKYSYCQPNAIRVIWVGYSSGILRCIRTEFPIYLCISRVLNLIILTTTVSALLIISDPVGSDLSDHQSVSRPFSTLLSARLSRQVTWHLNPLHYTNMTAWCWHGIPDELEALSSPMWVSCFSHNKISDHF